jgi:tetratricopeptide (TPR) repeat protein
MKSIFSVIPQFIFAMVLAVVSTATASTNENNEAARIMEAMKLYAQATPMDQFDTRRAELLSQSKSILLMQAAITLSPEDPKLFIALAILYDHQGAYEYAVPILDQALVLDPENQLALDYKISIQQKIESQNLAMESSTPAHKMATPHSTDTQSSE